MHRQFLEKYLKILIIFKIFAMIEEIHFILHVVNGILIIILNVIWYNYMYSNTCTNKYKYTYSNLFILMLVQISIISLTFFENISIRNNFFKTFSTIYNESILSKKFSLIYTMFEVSDGNSFSQRFRK